LQHCCIELTGLYHLKGMSGTGDSRATYMRQTALKFVHGEATEILRQLAFDQQRWCRDSLGIVASERRWRRAG
jgi:hypothetical protein